MGKYFHRFQICYETGASCINQAKVSGGDAGCMTTVYIINTDTYIYSE